MLSIQATQFFINALIGAFVIYILTNSPKLRKLRIVLLFALIIGSVVYLKLLSVLFFLLFFVSAYLLAKKIFKIEDNILALLIGIFSIIQIYIVLSLLINPSVSYFAIIFLSLANIFFNFQHNIVIMRDLVRGLSIIVQKFNIFDWWLILITAVLGSLPQFHWDAAHANLYNAKWYILNNSFAPLAESISSLFPQNAVAYYSLFYKIGEHQGLHLSFFLPLVLIILLVKQFIFKSKISKVLSLAIYAALLTPIVIFQASSGYYDLLIACLLMGAVYALTYSAKKDLIQACLAASFLIGFAAGMKYFALVLIPLPICILLLQRSNLRKFILPIIALTVFIPIFSLGIWMLRSYSSTGSPVFPFFQSYFPTPNMWVGSDRLEQNFMIQSTMKTIDWIKGGFLTYPGISYLHSPEFMEAAKGYTGTIYIFGMLGQIVVLILVIKRVLIKRVIATSELIFTLLFIAYFIVGILTRYYRYLMPFQLVLLLSAVLLINKLFVFTFRIKSIIGVLLACVIILNFHNMVEYYRYYPISNPQLFRPDYYQNPLSSTGPIGYLNQHSTKYERILDASQYLLSRVHLTPTTYQCNWYWINGSQLIVDQSYAELLSQFDYLVTSDPPETAVNYCQEFVSKVVSDPGNTLVYSDHVTHRIYKLQHEKK